MLATYQRNPVDTEEPA